MEVATRSKLLAKRVGQRIRTNCTNETTRETKDRRVASFTGHVSDQTKHSRTVECFAGILPLKIVEPRTVGIR